MSNLLDKSSIVLSPTAYDNSKVLCVKPSDGSGDFDFSRNSAATRVNAQGLVEDVQILSSNLVQNGDFSQLGSEEVTNGNFATDLSGWSSITNVTWSSNFGGSAFMNANGTNAQFRQFLSYVVGKTYRISWEVKENNGCDLFRVYNNGGFTNITDNFVGTHTLYFTQTSGTLFLLRNDTIGSNITIDNVSVVEVGQNWDLTGTWIIGDNVANCDGSQSGNADLIQALSTGAGKQYKITYTVSNYLAGDIKVRLSSGNTTSAQSSNGTFTEIITAVVNGGFRLRGNDTFNGSVTNISVIEITDDTNLPRINYEGFSFDGSGNIIPDSGCGSWLFEPQSTNLITYSEDFSQSYWNTYGAEVSRTLDTSQANPSGSNGSYIFEGVSGLRRFGKVISVTPNTDYTISFYAKNINATLLRLLFTNSSVSSKIYTSEVSTTKWSRVEVSFTSGAGTSTTIQILRDLPIGESVYIWGVQVEEQSYATSYIPTDGTSVTRNQDVCNNGGSVSTINSTSGVLYAEIAALANSNDNRRISLSDGTLNNRILLYYGTSNSLLILFILNGVTQATFTYAYTITNFSKIAFKYKENDFALWVDGLEVATDTNGNTFSLNTLDRLNFDTATGGLNFFGKTKALAVWKEALTDTELQELTTI
tara:strand:+ start:65 stop:2005 length:1941 start_codon:yes stop_codon:yes gene_type:complete